jgi:predicted ATPase/DNA-binding SARP family transcriptional activator
MARLAVSLFGSPQVALDGVPITSFRYDKVFALLAYLAVEPDRLHRRELLAGMLWPDKAERSARRSLSQAIFTLRQVIADERGAPPCLLVTGAGLQLNPAADVSLDLALWSQLLDACAAHQHGPGELCDECARQLEQCAALYRGDFLAGFSLADSPAFDEWATCTRERFRLQALAALEMLAARSERHGDRAAIAWLRRLVELEPWHEDAHRRLMRAYDRSGDRAAALLQYQRGRQALASELGIEPEAETTALYDQLCRGDEAQSVDRRVEAQLIAADSTSPQPSLAVSARHRLPRPTTPLVGREQELAAIMELLADPASHLVTLVGPSGIGKTRLALEAARSSATRPVAWVSLAALRDPGQLAFAIANALGITFHGQASPHEQLLDHLGNAELLLALDNFEHLLEGARLIAAIEERAPRVRVLITSHERLNLRGEWVVAVESLSLPAGDDPSAMASSGAVRLFVQCARRLDPQRTFSVEDWQHVARICRQVGGMPLGIELAAGWSALLSYAEIADEIEQSLNFLTTSARDMPERHRSMRAVFDYSWRLLAEHERAVFARLSVFRGGFTRAAAEAGAQADLTALLALMNKSLLRRSPDGRYELHALLREYGAEKLRADPAAEDAARDRHADYFAAFLARCEQRLKSGDQLAALAEVGAELENVCAAYRRLSSQARWEPLGASIGGLFVFFAATGRALEAEAIFGAATKELLERGAAGAATELVLGRLLCARGAFAMRLGLYDAARAVLARSIESLRRQDAASDLALALNMLAATIHLLGQYEEEIAVLQESIALGRSVADHWITAYSLNDLGMAIFLHGDTAAALRYAQESLGMFRQIGDQRGASFALNNLGVFTQQLGNHAGAERLFRESLEVRRAIDDRWGIATTLTQIGRVVGAQGSLHDAYAAFHQALSSALEVRALPAALDALVELAAHLACEGDTGRAATMLELSMRHPASSRQARARAGRLLASLPQRATGLLVQLPERDADRALATLVASLVRPPGRF